LNSQLYEELIGNAFLAPGGILVFNTALDIGVSDGRSLFLSVLMPRLRDINDSQPVIA
jgi:hypothetical protein